MLVPVRCFTCGNVVADNYLEKIIYANKHLNIFLPSSAIVPVLKFALYAVDENLKKIFSAKCGILTNWASNLRGTELANHVFRNSPNALHFIDPADIDVRRDEFKDALNVISEVTDVLSINENECDSLTRALGFGSILSSEPTNTDLIKKAARIISDNFGIEVDLHTRIGAAWSNGKEVLFEAAFNVPVHTMTGSGDCWDAADVVGHLAGLDPNERLLFSNACSALYIQNESFESPTMDELVQFLKNSYTYR